MECEANLKAVEAEEKTFISLGITGVKVVGEGMERMNRRGIRRK